MKEYETVFVIRPDGAESQTNQLLERVNTTIGRHNGAILQQKNWGKKDLAYRVQKYNQGVYFYYNYTGDSGLVADLERTLKLHDLPMKYLTVKIAEEVDVEARRREIAKAEEEIKTPVPAVLLEPIEAGTEEVTDD